MANFAAMSFACEGGHQIPAEDRNGLGWVANLLNRLGRWDDEYGVRLFLQQATSVELGPEHHSTLTDMSCLPDVLNAQGKYEQAEEIYR